MTVSSSPYFSSSRVALFINGMLVDDAVGISYNVRDPKTAIHGYNDYDARRFIPGKSIVIGQIAIHFRYHGYLTYAIRSQPGPRALVDSLNDMRQLKNYENIDNYQLLFREFDDVESKADSIFEAYQTYLRNQGARNLERESSRRVPLEYIDFVQDTYWNYGDQEERAPIETRPGRTRSKFDIVVRFGDIDAEWDPGTTIIIEDVNLTDAGTAIYAEVPDDGTPVREVYSFTARTIRPLRVNSPTMDPLELRNGS